MPSSRWMIHVDVRYCARRTLLLRTSWNTMIVPRRWFNSGCEAPICVGLNDQSSHHHLLYCAAGAVGDEIGDRAWNIVNRLALATTGGQAEAGGRPGSRRSQSLQVLRDASCVLADLITLDLLLHNWQRGHDVWLTDSNPRPFSMHELARQMPMVRLVVSDGPPTC